MKKIFFAAALAGAAMLASCGGGNADGVQKGSLSKFDSLSYALGANIGYSLGYQMKDIPFDAQLIRKGVEETALGKSSLSHDDALETLRTYFMTKRGERAQAIAKQRAEADSMRRAGGDTTKVEYPAADPAMFATEEERAENVNIGMSVVKGNTSLLDALNSYLSTMTADDFNALMDEAIAVQPEI